MREKSRKTIIIFIVLFIISINLSFSGVFAAIPTSGNERSQLLQISQTDFDTRETSLARLMDWTAYPEVGSIANLVTDPNDHQSATMYGSFYKKNDFTLFVFTPYNENVTLSGVMSFNWSSSGIKDISSQDAYGTTSLAVWGYNETSFVKYVRLWEYVQHDTVEQDLMTIYLNWTASNTTISTCDSITDWSYTEFDSIALDTEEKQEGTASIKGVEDELEPATGYLLTYDPDGYFDWYRTIGAHQWIHWTTSNDTTPYATYIKLTDKNGDALAYWLYFTPDLDWSDWQIAFNDYDYAPPSISFDWNNVDSISYVWITDTSVNDNDTLTMWVDFIYVYEGVSGGGVDFDKDEVYCLDFSVVPPDYDATDDTALDTREPFWVTISDYLYTGEESPSYTYLPEKFHLGTAIDFGNLWWLTPARVTEELLRRGYYNIFYYAGMGTRVTEKTTDGMIDLSTPLNDASQHWNQAFFDECDNAGIDVILAISMGYSSFGNGGEINYGSSAYDYCLYQRDCEGYLGWTGWIPTTLYISPTNETMTDYYAWAYQNFSSTMFSFFGSDTKISASEIFWWHYGVRRTTLIQDASVGEFTVYVQNATGFSVNDVVSIRSYYTSEVRTISDVDYEANTITFSSMLSQNHLVSLYGDVYGENYPQKPHIYDPAATSLYYAEYSEEMYVFTSVEDDYSDPSANQTVEWCNEALNYYVLNMSDASKTISSSVQVGILTDPTFMPSGLMQALNQIPVYTDLSLDFIIIEDYSQVMEGDWNQVNSDMEYAVYPDWYYLTGIVVDGDNTNMLNATLLAYEHGARMVYTWSWHQQRNYGIDFLEWNAVISCELLNGKVDGTWVFTETNYYQFDSSYQNLNGWEAIHECYIGFSDGVHWISAKYDVQDQAFTLLTGGDYVKLKAGTVENDTASEFSVIFKVYFKATLFDTHDIDIYMKATQVDGTASEWSIVEENLFNLINNPATRPKKR